MVELSYKKHVSVNPEKELIVCYNLLSQGQNYSIECYLENEEKKENSTYCKVSGFTKDRQTGVTLIETIAKGEVLPVHVMDIVEDYFA